MGASLGTMALLTVTMKVKTVTKTIALPGLHGNHGVVVLLNVKKVVAMIQREHDTDVGIRRTVLANSVLVVKQLPEQEKTAVEMPVMFAIKNRQRAVTKMSNVLLNVNGLIGVTGVVVLLHVKTVSESEEEQITKMMVPLATVPALSLNDVLLLKLKSVLNAWTTTKNVTRFQPVSVQISDIVHSLNDFVTNIVVIVQNEERDQFLIDSQDSLISLFLNF